MQKEDLIVETSIQISEPEEKADYNVEDKEEVLVSNLNIDNTEDEDHSDNLETETESETVSFHSEDNIEEQEMFLEELGLKDKMVQLPKEITYIHRDKNILNRISRWLGGNL